MTILTQPRVNAWLGHLSRELAGQVSSSWSDKPNCNVTQARRLVPIVRSEYVDHIPTQVARRTVCINDQYQSGALC